MFRVEARSLADYGQQVGRAAEDAEACKKYMDANCQIGGWSGDRGLFNILAYQHDGVIAAVGGMLTHLSELLRKSQAELQGAADGYRQADSGSSARIDASYQVVTRPSIDAARD